MAANKNYWEELQEKNAAAAGIQVAPSVSPSDITKSYYTTPTTEANYEVNRPVYQQSQAVKDAADQVAQIEQGKPGPFQSSYNDQIQSMIDSILNRTAFSYDPAADPLYAHYADQYQRRGRLAMKDTMAQSAALTGGYGNTYAQQAGQQSYQAYLERMNDIIPELRDAAYQMYRDEGDIQRANLGMLQTADSIDYDRYRDTIGDWHTELNYFYNKFSDMSDNEYNIYLNDAAAWEADRAYWYQKEQDDLAQENWEREFELAQQSKSSSGGSRNKQEEAPAVELGTTTYEGGIKEIQRLVNQGVVKRNSTEYNDLLDEVIKRQKVDTNQSTSRRMSGYTR